MTHDVFICYAHEDKTIADAICAKLEKQSLRCWIAPRDILPSANYAEAIIDAIDRSRIFVLVFSSHANKSQHVMREAERAVHDGHPIIPFRIESLSPSGALEYYIGPQHWLDAMTPPLEAHLGRLAEIVGLLLKEPKKRLGKPAKKRRKSAKSEDEGHPIRQKPETLSSEQPDQQLRCPRCGQELEISATSCGQCGAAVAEIPTTATAASDTKAKHTPFEGERNWREPSYETLQAKERGLARKANEQASFTKKQRFDMGQRKNRLVVACALWIILILSTSIVAGYTLLPGPTARIFGVERVGDGHLHISVGDGGAVDIWFNKDRTYLMTTTPVNAQPQSLSGGYTFRTFLDVGSLILKNQDGQTFFATLRDGNFNMVSDRVQLVGHYDWAPQLS